MQYFHSLRTDDWQWRCGKKFGVLLAGKKQFAWGRTGGWTQVIIIGSLTAFDNVCFAAKMWVEMEKWNRHRAEWISFKAMSGKSFWGKDDIIASGRATRETQTPLR